MVYWWLPAFSDIQILLFIVSIIYLRIRGYNAIIVIFVSWFMIIYEPRESTTTKDEIA